jgi:type IX secretion system PorP/SprF family membrane protein
LTGTGKPILNKMPVFRDQNILFTLFLLIISELTLSSQETSLYENYYLDIFIINPAATGANYFPEADLSVRKQWVGFPDAPATFLLAGNLRAGRREFYDSRKFLNKNPLKMAGRVGLGASVFADLNGPLTYTGGILSYAYHLPVTSRSTLSLGLSAIGSYYAFNSSVLKPDQPDDPYLLTGNENRFSANFNLGIYFRNDDFFTGLSVDKILPDYIANLKDKKEQPSFFLLGGTKIKISGNSLILEPAVVIKKTGNADPSIDFHTKLYFRRLTWIALSYSTAGKLNFRFGIRLYKMLYAGYNYEYTLGDVASYSIGTHEIHLGINLGMTGMEKNRADRN